MDSLQEAFPGTSQKRRSHPQKKQSPAAEPASCELQLPGGIARATAHFRISSPHFPSPGRGLILQPNSTTKEEMQRPMVTQAGTGRPMGARRARQP